MYLGETLVLIHRSDLRRGVGNQVPTLLQVAFADKGYAASSDGEHNYELECEAAMPEVGGLSDDKNMMV